LANPNVTGQCDEEVAAAADVQMDESHQHHQRLWMTLHGSMWENPNIIHLKSAPSHEGSGPPYLMAIWVSPNGMSIGSAVFA